MGAFDRAEQLYNAILRTQPRLTDARYNLALLLLRSAKWQAALNHLNLLIEQGERAADIYFSRGRALSKLGRTHEALRSLEEAQRLKPLDANILLEIGNELLALQRIAEAIAQLKKALALAPGSTETAGALAQALIVGHHYAAAVALLEPAIARSPEDLRLLFALGQALFCLEDFAGAIRLFQQALKIDPTHGPSQIFYLSACRDGGFWDLEAQAFAAARNSIAADQRGDQTLTLSQSLIYFPFRIDELDKLARARAAQVNRIAALYPRIETQFSDASERIRIGYLSPDFRQHPTMHLIVDLLALHRRDWFSVHGYNIGALDGSVWQQRAEQNLDSFTDLSQMSSRDAAHRIAQDRIDVLIDLAVYTQFARPEIAAMRPAPLQLQWLGFPCTSGSACYDYILADEVVIPAAQAPFYAEQILWLPQCYLPHRQLEPIAPPPCRAEIGLPENGIVFCNLGIPRKISQSSFASWCNILQQVKDSVLWLLDMPETMKSSLYRYADSMGLDPGRLVFAPRLPLSDHLARLLCADLFLDNFIYGAHTTAFDALNAGVPVLTLQGESFAARVGASILTAIDLPELICGDTASYEQRAVALAKAPGELQAIRRRLAAHRTTTPLFDLASFGASFDLAIKHLVERARQGVRPSHLRVRDLL